MKRLEDFLEIGELPSKPAGPNCCMLEMVCLPENIEKISNDFNYQLISNLGIRITDRDEYKNLELRYKEGKLFVKIAWEGFMRETLALELNNLLTGRKIKYKGYGDIIVTEEVKGEKLEHRYLQEEMKTSRKYAHQYGMLQEFSRILGLIDRETRNLILSSCGEVRNIDFGQSFMHDSSLTLPEMDLELLPSLLYIFESSIGQREAKRTIRNNIERNFNRLNEVLSCIGEAEMARLNRGYKKNNATEIIHPKEIILTYCKRNKWHDLANALE